VKFDSQDHYIVTGNGDDSGQTSYSATLPVAGIMFKAFPTMHFYASYGEGFQTPIVAELAYRASGGTGLNLNLQAATSRNSELGMKVQDGDLSAELALFHASTENEIVINTNTGGRSTYQNAGRTRRRGAEVSVSYKFSDLWLAQFAYTYLEATYTDAYHTCTATPCATPTVLVAAGNRLPGIPLDSLYASIRFGRDTGFHVSANVQNVSNVAVNDINTVFAPNYFVAGVEAGYGIDFDHWKLNGFVRVNNVLDENYVGSIIVNDGNSRFFEPGPPVAVLGGINVSWK
jgi:iron complex outermembrane receptor protein